MQQETAAIQQQPTSTLVVIPQKNHSDLTLELVEALYEQDPNTNFLIVDNGSDPKDVDHLDVLFDESIGGYNVRLVTQTEPNLHASWNYGLEMARRGNYDYIAILNNDITPGGDFIRGLINPMTKVWNIVGVCPNYDGRTDLQPGTVLTTQDICAGRYDGTGGFAGFAFALRTSWVHTFGYQFPEECAFWYGDNDLINSIQVTGALSVITGDTTVQHEGSTTIKSEFGSEVPATADDDRKAYEAKWIGVGLQLAGTHQ